MRSSRKSFPIASIFASTAVALGIAISPQALAVSNSATIPVLLYHTWIHSGCTYETNALIALQQDLETLYDNGYTVVPDYWIAEWVVGDMDGSQLPAKIVGITFDDGPNSDWVDADYAGCGYATSGKTVLNNFKAAHPDLPWYSPHATSFVIASQVARGDISGGSGMSSSWWYAAQNSGIMEIYNHSVDHDHPSIASQQWDPLILSYIAVGGYGDGNWVGQSDFEHRIDTYQEADIEVRKAAAYISGVIGVWPDLFAYPYGGASSYIRNTYFPTYGSEHQTYAAFCIESPEGVQGASASSASYALRSSSRWCIPRLTYGWSWGTSGNDSVLSILSGANE